jgi:hypothetical protein
MLISIDDVARHGVLKDAPSTELPPGAWTDALNMSFYDGRARKAAGSKVFKSGTTIAPYSLLPMKVLTQNFWVYGGLTKVYAILGPNVGDITRTSGGDYTMTTTQRWNGGVLNGVPVLNNGADVPQYWASPALGSPLANLPNWPSTHRAKIIRPYKAYLIAMDITKSGVSYPALVLWSHTADPGTVPSSWDVTNASVDAGEVPLAEELSAIVDGVQLGEAFVIYKAGSVHLMQSSGDANIFLFRTAFGEFGALAQDCVRELKGKHLVVTDDDVLIHDGVNAETVIDARNRRALFSDIDPSYAFRSTLVENHPRSEMLFCYPSNGSEYLNKAAVWNWQSNTWTFKELPAGVLSVQSSQFGPGGASDSWEADSVTWDGESILQWDDPSFAAFGDAIIYGDGPGLELVQHDESRFLDEAGVAYESYLERRQCSLVGVKNDGTPRYDPTSLKFIRALWPRIEATRGTKIEISIGTQMSSGEPIAWEGPITFHVGEDEFINPLVQGRLISYRFAESSGVDWSLLGYDVELEISGKRGG